MYLLLLFLKNGKRKIHRVLYPLIYTRYFEMEYAFFEERPLYRSVYKHKHHIIVIS